MELKTIKDHIRLEAGKAIDSIETAKSIQEFSDKLIEEFRRKSCLLQFSSVNIPTSMKNLNINAVDTSGFDKKTFEKKKRLRMRMTSIRWP